MSIGKYRSELVIIICKSLIHLGMDLNNCDETLFARDGMGRAYDKLTPEEAAEKG